MTLKPFENVTESTEPVQTYRCPCCKFKTLYGRAQDEICPICFWEDDGQDDHDADIVRGGPNRVLSLRQAQKNFAEYHAKDRQSVANVRKPFSEEE